MNDLILSMIGSHFDLDCLWNLDCGASTYTSVLTMSHRKRPVRDVLTEIGVFNVEVTGGP